VSWVRVGIGLILLGVVGACEKGPTDKEQSNSGGAAAAQAQSRESGSPFHDVGFEQACKLAQKEGKVVMIDFYTTWCAPCKMLDRFTWNDESVRKWLRDQTVALKVNAEKERGLAQRYRVTAYPTIVFLKPDGQEIGRIEGFLWPQPFLKVAADRIAGGRSRAG